MNNQQQIDELVKLVNEMPEQRLGQLIVNAFGMSERYDASKLDLDLFYITDEKLIELISNFISVTRKRNEVHT